MPTKAEIARTFEMYNAVLFGGRLQVPNIMVRRMRDCARYYWPEPGRDKGEYSSETLRMGLLVISSTVHHKMTWRASLLHEMAHMAVIEDENDDHGPLFTSECNRVGVLIGLDFVEIEESWNWPAHHLGLVDSDQNILEDS